MALNFSAFQNLKEESQLNLGAFNQLSKPDSSLLRIIPPPTSPREAPKLNVSAFQAPQPTEGKFFMSAAPAQVEDDSILRKVIKAVLPRNIEIKFGITESNIAEQMMKNEDSRQVYLRQKKLEETFKREGVPEDIVINPEKYLPAGYKEPTTFGGQLKEGITYGYYSTIKPAIGYLTESMGQELGSPELRKWGEEFGDKQTAYLLKRPELLAPADLKGFFEGGAKDPRRYARTIGEAVPFIATMLGTGVIAAATKNPVIVKSVIYGSIFSIEKGNAYKQMIDNGVAPDSAASASTLYGAISSFIENSLGFKPVEMVLGSARPIVFNNFKSFMLKELPKLGVGYLNNILQEGAEESAQQLAQNLITKWMNQSQGIWEGVADAFPSGAVAALPFGVSDVVNRLRETSLQQQISELQ